MNHFILSFQEMYIIFRSPIFFNHGQFAADLGTITVFKLEFDLIS